MWMPRKLSVTAVASRGSYRTHDLEIIHDPYIYLGLFCYRDDGGSYWCLKNAQMERSEAANEPVKTFSDGIIQEQTLHL
jgi:hypothetical protein